VVCRPRHDLRQALRPVVHLAKAFDKLASKNNEIFLKAYFRVHVIMLPSLLGLYAGHLRTTKADDELSEQNELLQLVRAQLSYFFDIKATLSKETQEAEAEPEPEEEASDDEGKQRKTYRLKSLEVMKLRGGKIWQLHLLSLVPQALLSVVQPPVAGSSSSSTQTGGLQLQYLYHVAGCVDRHLLRDVAQVLNTLARRRYTSYAQLSIKDVVNAAAFVDTVAKYLLETVRCQALEAFKTAIDPRKGNPLSFKGHSESQDEKSLGELLFFLMNVATHLALDNASPQQIGFN